MTPQDDPEALLKSFKWVTVALELDWSCWVGQLGVLLTGQVQGAYWAMSCGEELDYDKVKKEILYQLGINPERYCQTF